MVPTEKSGGSAATGPHGFDGVRMCFICQITSIFAIKMILGLSDSDIELKILAQLF